MRKSGRHRVILIFIVSIFAQTAQGRALDFRQALELALQKAPSMVSARESRKIRELEQSNAVSVLLPSLDLSATHGLSKIVLPKGTGSVKILTPRLL